MSERKHSSPLAGKRRSLALERLEPRLMLDGTVNCVLHGGTLTIRGDGLDNAIQVLIVDQQIVVEGYAVHETDVTQVAGDSAAPAARVHNIRILMGGGEDLVGIGQFGDDARVNRFEARLSVDLGDGPDVLGLGYAYGLGQPTADVIVRGPATVRAGDGADRVIVEGLTVAKNLTIDMGAGDDTMAVWPWPGQGAHSQVGGALILKGGSGSDDFSVGTLAAKSIRVDTGASPVGGHDHFILQGYSETRYLSVRCGGDAGVETYIANVKGQVNISVAGLAQVNLDGNIDGNVRINTGRADGGLSDDDFVSFIGGRIKGNISLSLGDGNDQVGFSQLGTEFNGRVNVNCGGGNDWVGIGSGGDATFTMPIHVSLGAGDDQAVVGGTAETGGTARFSDHRVSIVDGGTGSNTLTDNSHTGLVEFRHFEE